MSSVMQSTAALKRDIKQLQKTAVAFIFDDGYANHKSVVAPLFESRGLRCGFAPHVKAVDYSGRLSKTDIVELRNKGHEFINHSYSHETLGNDKTAQFVRAEVNDAWAFWHKVGGSVTTFVTPNSVLGDNHLPIIKTRHPYAYTKSGVIGVAMRDVDNHELYRQSLESLTLAECKQAIDDAVKNGGSAVFYAHDVVNDDAIYNMIVDLLDYCVVVGAPVVVPQDAAQVASSGDNTEVTKMKNGKAIYNRRDGWSASNGATVTVDGNEDIRVVASAAGESLIQKVIAFNMDDEGLVTFSAALRKISGSIGANNTIGFKVTDFDTSDVLYQLEETIGGLDTEYRRYHLTGGTYAKKVTALIYFRVDFAATNDEVLIRDPLIRYGNNVLPMVKSEINKTFTVSFVGLPIAASGYFLNTLDLVDQSDNGLFEVEDNKIKFKKVGRVIVDTVVTTYGVNSYTGDGGMLVIDYGIDKQSAHLSGGSHVTGASKEVTLDIDGEQNVAFSLFNVGGDFNLNTTYSKVTIRELRG